MYNSGPSKVIAYFRQRVSHMAVESTNQNHIGHEGTWELKDCVNPDLAKYGFQNYIHSRQTFLSLGLFCYSEESLSTFC